MLALQDLSKPSYLSKWYRVLHHIEWSELQISCFPYFIHGDDITYYICLSKLSCICIFIPPHTKLQRLRCASQSKHCRLMTNTASLSQRPFAHLLESPLLLAPTQGQIDSEDPHAYLLQKCLQDLTLDEHLVSISRSGILTCQNGRLPNLQLQPTPLHVQMSPWQRPSAHCPYLLKITANKINKILSNATWQLQPKIYVARLWVTNDRQLPCHDRNRIFIAA